VAELRQERGLTQEELAGVLGVAARYVQMMEAGDQNVTLKTVERVAEGLDVPASELLSGRRKPKV